MENPFTQSDGCTWWAWKRMKEAEGFEITFSRDTNRHGGEWYDIVNNMNAFAPQNPKTSLEHCIACYSGGYGHVSFIESVDEEAETVTTSEYWNGCPDLPYTKTRTFEEFFAGSTQSNWTFQGYLRSW